MSEAESKPRESRPATAGVRTIGIVVAVLGVVFLVAGVVTYALVSSTLAEENITVADDARRFAGDDVNGPFTAYYQADIIATHAEGIAGGKTYAELPQDDPNRAAVMNASFLRASLFTSVVAFGVAAFVAVMGAILIAIGWALIRLGKAQTLTRL
jgi:predicted phage tail protein